MMRYLSLQWKNGSGNLAKFSSLLFWDVRGWIDHRGDSMVLQTLRTYSWSSPDSKAWWTMSFQRFLSKHFHSYCSEVCLRLTKPESRVFSRVCSTGWLILFSQCSETSNWWQMLWPSVREHHGNDHVEKWAHLEFSPLRIAGDMQGKRGKLNTDNLLIFSR